MSQRRDIVIWLAGLLAGCTRMAPPLRLAYHAWPGYAPLQLVRTLGWMDPEQLQVQDTGSASESLAALENGQADAAALTLDEVLQGRARGLPLQVVALLDLSSGADVLLGRRQVRTVADLKGKRLGLEPGAVGALMAYNALQSAGLTFDDVKLVPLPFDQHHAAWMVERVDALVTFEPLASRLVRQGAHPLYNSHQLPPPLVIADVLAIHPRALDAHTPHLRQLLQGVFRALHHLHTLTLDAQYRLAPWLGLPPEEVLLAFKGLRLVGWQENRSQLSDNAPPLGHTAEHLMQFMHERGLLPQRPQLDGLIDGRYLPLEEVL